MKLINYFYFRLYLLGVRFDNRWKGDINYLYLPISFFIILEGLFLICFFGEIELATSLNFLSDIGNFLGKSFGFVVILVLFLVNYFYYIRNSRWKTIVGRYKKVKFKKKLQRNIYEGITVLFAIVIFISLMVWLLSVSSRNNFEVSHGRWFY